MFSYYSTLFSTPLLRNINLFTPPNMGIAPSTPTATIAVTATLTSIAAITVILRLWSRKVVNIKPGWEDWLIIVALVRDLLPFVLGRSHDS